MATEYAINLIKTGTSALSPELGAVEKWLRRGAIIAIIFLLVVGGGTVGLFVYLQNQQQSLTTQQSSLATAIGQYQTQESALVALRDRIAAVSKILINRPLYGQLLDRLTVIALPPKLATVTVDELGKASILIHADSLDDALAVVTAIVSPDMASYIKSPELGSFTLDDKGKIEMNIGFKIGS